MKTICSCIVTSLNHIQALLVKKTLHHFEIHDSSHDGRIDDDNLLVKLNLDGIGLINPLESSGNQCNFCLVLLKISLINIDLKLNYPISR